MSTRKRPFVLPPDFDPDDPEELVNLRIRLLDEQFELRRQQDEAWRGRDHCAKHKPEEWTYEVMLQAARATYWNELTVPTSHRAALVQLVNYALCALESHDIRAARARAETTEGSGDGVAADVAGAVAAADPARDGAPDGPPGGVGAAGL
jgi:hypothetical protein